MKESAYLAEKLGTSFRCLFCVSHSQFPVPYRVIFLLFLCFSDFYPLYRILIPLMIFPVINNKKRLPIVDYLSLAYGALTSTLRRLQ